LKIIFRLLVTNAWSRDFVLVNATHEDISPNESPHIWNSRIALLALLGGLAAYSQEPLSLRQAIQQALSQNPDVAIAQAGNQDAKASATLARTALFPS